MALDVSQVTSNKAGPTTARAPEDPEKATRPAPAVREEDEAQEENLVPTEIDPARLAEAVKRANQMTEALAADSRMLRFEVFEATGDVVVKVLAEESEEIVRQMPSEEFLRMASKLRDFRSLLLDRVA